MNLAKAKQRQVKQQGQIGRRTSIVPDSRDTRQPALEVNASMRSARRGGGSSDQLLRALGMAREATVGLQAYAEERHVEQEADNITQGAADHAAGTVDAEMMERSDGYRNAVTKGRTITRFTAATQDFDHDLRGVIEQQESPSLEARQAEVTQRIERFFREFAQDPETGDLREFLQSPGAMRYLGQAIHESRPEFEARAMARIEQRFNEEALVHFSQNIADQAEQDGTLDLEFSLSLLPDTVPDGERADTLITSVFNAAEQLKARGRFEEANALAAALRGYKDQPRETGTPELADMPEDQLDPVTRFERSGEVPELVGLDAVQFSAQQQARINSLYDQLTTSIRSEWREAQQDEQSFNASKLALGIFGQGSLVLPQDISEAIDSGSISPEAGLALFRMQRTEQDRHEASLDRREARAERAERRRREREREHYAAAIIGPLMAGNTSTGSARSAALEFAGGIDDPVVAASVLQDVLRAANAYESGVMESEPVRRRVRGIDVELRDQWQAHIASHPGLLGSAKRHAAEEVNGLLDQALAHYSRLVAEGKSDEEAWSMTDQRYGTRLNGVLPQ